MQNSLLSYIEISKENLIHNIKQFRKFLKEDVKIAAVIKANAYGHGDLQVVEIANPYVDYFQVDSIEECHRVRNVTKKPILILVF
jgi:alanine racemase